MFSSPAVLSPASTRPPPSPLLRRNAPARMSEVTGVAFYIAGLGAFGRKIRVRSLPLPAAPLASNPPPSPSPHLPPSLFALPDAPLVLPTPPW
jgi:hypothetical protein